MIELTTPTSSQEDPELLGQHEGWDVYPMPVFVTINTPDVSRMASWFRDALGFGVMFVGPDSGDGPTMVHLRRMKYQDVLIAAGLEHNIDRDRSLTVTFQAMTDTEVDLLAEQAAGHGDVEGPYDTPWNTREVTVIDPDGHHFVFTGRRTDSPVGSLDEATGIDQ